MNELKAYLETFIHFTESEMEVFISLFSEIKLKKKDYFAKEGEFSSKLGFVSNGVLRAFFRNNSGNEYNKTFFTPSSFIAAYSIITTKHKHFSSSQSLTDSTLIITHFKQITSINKKYPKFESRTRVIAENKFALKEKREIELITLEATE